jgi:hypothetical protein
MSKFKVGDRVRLAADNDGFGLVGDTGSVMKENCGAEDARIKFDVERKGNHEWLVPWNKLQHIYTSCAAAEVDNLAAEYGAPKAKFKVGDRVAVDWSHPMWVGEAVVESVDNGIAIVKYDNGKSGGFPLKHLTLIAVAPATATLRIEAGKFYKTRDGRKVGPYHHAFSDIWRVGEDHSTAVFEDGTTNRNGRKTDADLVAEWTDEPAAKFKVGDKVGCTTNKATNYIIKKVNGDLVNVAAIHSNGSEATYTYDNQDAGIFFHLPPTSIADIVARHSQTGTAIVCLLENGKPKPSTVPFVHGDAKAAEREALRLANVHKGREFGVYTLGEVRKVEKTFEHEWQRLAYDGQVIAAIKELRSKTGLHLKTAKDAVEDWRKREAA